MKKKPVKISESEKLTAKQLQLAALDHYNDYSVKTLRQMLKLTPVRIDDTDAIINRAEKYFDLCEKNQRVPTAKGLAANIGIHSSTMQGWLENHPDHDTSIFLAKVLDIMADNLEQGLLSGNTNTVGSIFLLKSQHGYREAQEVVMRHEKSEKKTLSQLEAEIESEIIDADFKEI